MRKTEKWLAAGLVMLLAGGLLAADWPQFRGPNANGFAPDTGINKDWKTTAPKQLWTYKMTDGGHATLSAADGKVFVLDHDGGKDVVRAIDLSTGKDAWTYSYDEPTTFDHGFENCTPVYDGGKLYTLSGSGLLKCLDAKAGKVIWELSLVTEYHAKAPKWHMAMSPVVDGDKLIVCPGGDASMVALDKATGKLLFKGGGTDSPAYDTPVIATIDGKREYVYATTTELQGVSTDDGSVIWQTPWKTGMDMTAPSPVVIGNSVFMTSGSKHGCELLDIKDGKATVRWSNKEMQSHFNTPILFEDHLYGTTDPGDLICMEVATGKVVWRQKGFEKGGVVVVDGVLLAVNGGGGDVAMVKLDPAAYTELGRFNALTGKENWPPPIIADGKLVVRNPTTMACFDLK